MGKGQGDICLYRLPDILAAAEASTVYVVEGERDVETLRAMGHIATCNPAGAGKWAGIDPSPLEGCHVVIIADLDGETQKWAGQRHALAVERSLAPIAKSVRVVQCTRGKDITDHLAAGGTLDDLRSDGAATVDGSHVGKDTTARCPCSAAVTAAVTTAEARSLQSVYATGRTRSSPKSNRTAP